MKSEAAGVLEMSKALWLQVSWSYKSSLAYHMQLVLIEFTLRMHTNSF